MTSEPAERREQIALHLCQITKQFGNLVANDKINISLRRREVVALLGENGGGKTTLMNILFRQYVADEGEIEVFGKMMPKGDSRAILEASLGMAHQHFTLVENINVLENIILGTESLVPLHSRMGMRRSGSESCPHQPALM